MDYKYTGIILGKYDVGETDRIYAMYTKEAGMVRSLASGVRKPNAKLAGHLELITLSEIFVAKRRGMGKITGAIAVNNFSKIKNDIDSLEKVFYALDKMKRFLSEGEKDEKIFKLLVEFLETMDGIIGSRFEKNEKEWLVAFSFIFNLLNQTGYKLEAGHCAKCEKRLAPENNYFSASAGGVLCGACGRVENGKIPISAEAVKLIRIFLKNNLKSLVKLKVENRDIRYLKSVLNESCRWICG